MAVPRTTRRPARVVLGEVLAGLGRTRARRLALASAGLAALGTMTVWKAGALASVGTAFAAVEWRWVALALALNLLSVAVRAEAWRVVLDQAVPEPHPSRRALFSAFSVGLLGNIVLPGRAGELMRVALISRRLPRGRELWPSTLGSIIAHRLFDVVPSAGLVVYVLVAARLPPWARTGVIVALAVGGSLFFAALLAARRDGHLSLDGLGSARRLLHLVRRGLGVLRAPIPALGAAGLQTLGWALQLAAVWSAFRAFQIDAPVSAAALVLVVVNLVLAVPLWPGSVGLFQAAVALALVPSGVAYAHGLAYGIGLQAIETSVGIGLGLLFLAREGISFGKLRTLRRGQTLDLLGDGGPGAEADDR